MDLIQLVPALPPALSGIGDFAMLLARELLARHGTGTRFVVGDPGWNAPEAVAPFAAAAVAARSADALLARLDGPGTVLLHYVGYGYAHRGCPFWLVDALERWRRADAGRSRRLLLLFHEVHASGPPWSSAFWTGPFQQRLAARLARLADARRITTTISRAELHRTLRRGERDLPTTVAPVFSTLGEPDDLPPAAARERQVVVFGSRSVRSQLYTRTDELAAFCSQHDIARVVDVGTPLGGSISLGKTPWRQAGALPAAEASALFARSLAGWYTYPAPHLGKSTIFAAYCAHRLAPVTLAANREAGEGLRAGEHFLAGADDDAPFDAVAGAAHAWYHGHRLAVHARDIHALL